MTLRNYLGSMRSKNKKDTTVVDAIHKFDDTPPKIRRWYSDRANEFLAAATRVRCQRPLAHYTSIPWRHAARAERTNRTVPGGTRTALVQSALSEEWWALALKYWIT